MLDKIIFICYCLLFFLVPLLFTPLNFELFEFNKMLLTYGLTVIIAGCWLLKTINHKQLIIHRTPLDIPLLLFLAANILSTLLSIDQHTSIWGYYSRLNGGLLSVISYLLLYFAFVSNITKDKIFTLLKVALASGVIIAVWGILEHFGVSPSCVILRGEFNADCWIQDVRSRVFATLGQPNWMAAYLAMLIFPALYFFLTATKKTTLTTYYLLLTTYYLAFTFTYARGATLGLIVGMGVFIGAWILRHIKKNNILPLSMILISFLFINLLFGSALTRFQLTQLLPKNTSQVSLSTSEVEKRSSVTQLETGGTESGTIRLIVWQGAWDIFRHSPLFGSGVETFAYAYYQFRPASHNLVSEWDFLYNKAHNEYLNYLANTGIVGFAAYMAVIMVFVVHSVWFIVKHKKQNKPSAINYLLLTSLLASYLSYLVQNIFGFSVVAVALFFYLFPALAFVGTDSTKLLKLSSIPSFVGTSFQLIYRRPAYTKAAKVIILLLTFYLLFSIIKFWYADTLFSLGMRYSEADNPGRAYNYLTAASSLRKSEPFYKSELGYSAALAALALQSEDATSSSNLKDQAIKTTEQVLKDNPQNTSFWRTAVRTYFALSQIDKSFAQKSLDSLDQTIKLAPTDAKLYYNKAVILGQMDRNNEAIKSLQQAVQLKSNYREGFLALGLFYFDVGQKEKAIENVKKVLQLVPNDPEALEQLKTWNVSP